MRHCMSEPPSKTKRTKLLASAGRTSLRVVETFVVADSDVQLGAEQHRAVVVAGGPFRRASRRSSSTVPSNATLAVGLDLHGLPKSKTSGDSSSVNSRNASGRRLHRVARPRQVDTT